MIDNKNPDSKERILARIRGAKDSFELPDMLFDIPEQEIQSKSGVENLRHVFKAELEKLGVKVYDEPDGESVIKRMSAIIDGKSILSWDYEHLPYNAGEALKNENVIYGNENMGILEKAEIGLTGCDAAIAETGSLILIPGEGKPRTASLLPFTHIALVKRSSVYKSIGDFFADREREITQYPHINIISGPSRTADIELTLSIGVHGPGKVIVIIGP